MSLAKEVFGSTVDIRGADCGGGEPLADFILQDTFDIRQTQSKIHLLFLCAQARLDLLPKKLSNDSSCCQIFILRNDIYCYCWNLDIQLDELIVYETISSSTLDEELNDYIQNNGVNLQNFHFLFKNTLILDTRYSRFFQSEWFWKCT